MEVALKFVQLFIEYGQVFCRLVMVESFVANPVLRLRQCFVVSGYYLPMHKIGIDTFNLFMCEAAKIIHMVLACRPKTARFHPEQDAEFFFLR